MYHFPTETLLSSSFHCAEAPSLVPSHRVPPPPLAAPGSPTTQTGTAALDTPPDVTPDERLPELSSPSEPDQEAEPAEGEAAESDGETEEEKARRLLYCSLCKVAVNSASQLEAHNSGERVSAFRLVF